jgi:hypothetical protein
MFELRIFDPIGVAELLRERNELRDKIVELMGREREIDAELSCNRPRRKRPQPAKRLRKAVAR